MIHEIDEVLLPFSVGGVSAALCCCAAALPASVRCTAGRRPACISALRCGQHAAARLLHCSAAVTLLQWRCCASRLMRSAAGLGA